MTVFMQTLAIVLFIAFGGALAVSVAANSREAATICFWGFMISGFTVSYVLGKTTEIDINS